MVALVKTSPPEPSNLASAAERAEAHGDANLLEVQAWSILKSSSNP
jgi:hypothetical protein